MAADPNTIAAVHEKYMRGNPQFPILFEGGGLRIFKNPRNEIFVQDVKSGTEIRLAPYPHLEGGLEFTTNSLVEPIQINGGIGWLIAPR